MKKLLLVSLLAISTLSMAIGKNCVFNKTGKPLSINFYSKSGMWVATELIAPYTNDLPQTVDMHNLTSSKMTVKKGSHKASLKTPNVGDIHDYEINNDNHISFKKLNTILGISDGSNDNESAAPVESPQDKITRLQKENSDLTADNQTRQDHMDKLSDDIKRLRKKGAVGPMNSRKDERAKEDDKIKANTTKINNNNAQIQQLQAQVSA